MLWADTERFETGIPIPDAPWYGQSAFPGEALALSAQKKDRSHDSLHMTTVDNLIIDLDEAIFN